MKKGLIRVTNPGAVIVRRSFTPAQFGDLAELLPELEWLANLTNPANARLITLGLSGAPLWTCDPEFEKLRKY
jgi:hypothetical protein